LNSGVDILHGLFRGGFQRYIKVIN
jgi:hypothetical protein